MSAGDINEPLTPPDCDLRDFKYMGMDVRRLRDSKFASIEDAEAFRAGILLWCASWHQIPAASLPDDDIELSALAGYGRVVKEWKKARLAGALHGFLKCTDGRLYHPVIAEKANAAYLEKNKHRHLKMAERIRKMNAQRSKDGLSTAVIPSFDEWISAGMKDISCGFPAEKAGFPAEIRRKTLLKGKGKGKEYPPSPPPGGDVDSACAGNPEPPDSRTAGQPGTPHPDAENTPRTMDEYQHLPDENGDFLGKNSPTENIGDDEENADFALEKWSQKPTLAGEVAKAMRREGMATINQGSPQFTALINLIKTGELSIYTFSDAAKTAVENGGNFQYALKIIENQLGATKRMSEKITAQRSSKMADILAGAI